MEFRHILLDKIDLQPIKSQNIPSDFNYDARLGAWVSNHDGSLLVEHPSFAAVASKKKDIETGEDQK